MLCIAKRGTLFPDVELGSTKPKFLPFKSAMVLYGELALT